MRGKHCITTSGCLSADEVTREGGNVPPTYNSTPRCCRSTTEASACWLVLAAINVSARSVPQQSTCGTPLSPSKFIRGHDPNSSMDQTVDRYLELYSIPSSRLGFAANGWGMIDFCQLHAPRHAPDAVLIPSLGGGFRYLASSVQRLPYRSTSTVKRCPRVGQHVKREARGMINGKNSVESEVVVRA